ncbi:hypothetical protein [Xanthobacter agilis]|jgi:hypothetical protein|uniref:Uncharacterized protein n=1 Tax=Xanthobacter agilis TaxID=47492 RepID=A0ABU0LJC0_XANAG|nr:hypothetical protein [Xanthobacter agilis]MDQ0507197.1 hypothetical protein [Xanthobacter agilis]
MASEQDLWRTAWIIAEQYGAEGVDFAASMAQSFEIGGKHDDQQTWLAILHRVKELTDGAAGPGPQ